MLFITNRFPTQSIRTRPGRTFSFDMKNNAPSNSVYFCEVGEDNKHTEIGGKEFMKRVKQAEYRQVLLFVHGFNTMPEDSFRMTAELQAFCDAKKDKEVLVLPLVWPCDNDIGIVEDYWDDQRSADQSGYSFARVLEIFDQWRNSEENDPEIAPCLKRINMLAHSMGNRVLRQTLFCWNDYALANGVPLIFRNTFMVAADVVNETLHEGHTGELISHASRNVVVYYASDDMALRSSKAANLKNRIASRRLGHTGPENIEKTPHNVFSVDCDDINTAYDWPKGHNYFRSGKTEGRPGLVFEHIYQCIETGRVFPDDPHKRSIILS